MLHFKVVSSATGFYIVVYEALILIAIFYLPGSPGGINTTLTLLYANVFTIPGAENIKDDPAAIVAIDTPGFITGCESSYTAINRDRMTENEKLWFKG